jgi:hypothetical protein
MKTCKCKPGTSCFQCKQEQQRAAFRDNQRRVSNRHKRLDPLPAPRPVPQPPPPSPGQQYWVAPSSPLPSGTIGMFSWGSPVVSGGFLNMPPNSVQASCTGPVSELALGSVFAWRRFRVSVWPMLLTGARRVPWREAQMQAICLNAFPHSVPSMDCTCGIYAFNKPDVAGSSLTNDGSGPCVDTVVECWGTTLIGDKGIRTANARIVAATVDPQSLVYLDPYTQMLRPGEPGDLLLLVALLGDMYPGVTWYRDSATMLSVHPLSTILTKETPDGD